MHYLFCTPVSLKFNIPEDRWLDLKVYDQSNTEVDAEVFEELVKEFHGPFLVSLANEAPGKCCLLAYDLHIHHLGGSVELCKPLLRSHCLTLFYVSYYFFATFYLTMCWTMLLQLYTAPRYLCLLSKFCY